MKNKPLSSGAVSRHTFLFTVVWRCLTSHLPVHCRLALSHVTPSCSLSSGAVSRHTFLFTAEHTPTDYSPSSSCCSLDTAQAQNVCWNCSLSIPLLRFVPLPIPDYHNFTILSLTNGQRSFSDARLTILQSFLLDKWTKIFFRYQTILILQSFL